MRACRTGDAARDHASAKGTRFTGHVLLVLFFGAFALAFLLVGANSASDSITMLRRLLGAPYGEGYWGSARANVHGAPFEADGVYACDVQSQYYQSGKNGGWREESRHSFVHGAPQLTLEDGRLVTLGAPVRFVPFDGTTPNPARERSYRNQWSSFRGPRVFEQCVGNEPIFVDGCITHGSDGTTDQLVACAGEHDVSLTQGPRRARLAVHARPLVQQLGLLVLVLLGAFWFVAHRLRGRSSESTLGLAVDLAPRGLRETPTFWTRLRRALVYAPTLAFPAFFALLAAVTAAPSAALFAAFCIWGLSLVVLSPRALLRTLERLRRAVVDRPTTALATAEGDVVELAVRVSPSAPLRPSLLSGLPVAHSSLSIWERVVKSSGRSTTVTLERFYFGPAFGDVLQVEDSTGSGTLELGSAILDFPAQEILAPWNKLPEAIRSQAQLGFGEYLVRESMIRPGDSLYVLGPVQRTLDPGAEGRTAYRAAPTRARVSPDRASEDERHPLFVHAGTERTLLDAIESGLRRERLFARIVIGTVVAATLVLGGLVSLCLF